MIDPAAVGRRFEEHRDAILDDWFALLRFPTIGTDRARLRDCSACTAWLRRFLKRDGFEVEIATTSGQPVLWAERGGAPGAPTVLFYGHYDVQPVDPESAWTTPPFEPALREGRVYARGAQDNKGQFFAFLQGLRAAAAAGVPLPTVRLLLEGEEESGSGGLQGMLHEWRRRLAADVLLACDTHEHASGRPAITAGLRGIVTFTVTLHGPARDLHSGTHGGVAPNPALALARLLATLHDGDGAIAVPGYLDRVRPPAAAELALAADPAFDAAAYAAETGVEPCGGERNTPPVVRAGFRPTIEVNGLSSGYAGTGSKTIIPSCAMAKLSSRVCPDQDPADCLARLSAFLRERTPPGLRLAISEEQVGGGGFRLPIESPLVRLATDVLRELDPRGPVFVWEGASIPIVADLRRISSAAPLLVGFGREEDCIHAPNESFSLDQFRRGMTYSALMLQALGGGS